MAFKDFAIRLLIASIRQMLTFNVQGSTQLLDF